MGCDLATSTVRILLAEDFKPYRAAITSLLAAHSHFGVVCETSTGIEAVEKAKHLKPDLILIDIGLPDLSGLEAARRIHDLVPTAKIVFLTQETAVDLVAEALNVGASGYILKQKAWTDLLPGLAAILEGRRFVSDGLVNSDGSF